MKRKITAFLLAVLLCAATVLSASADAYIPPEPAAASYNILSAHEKDGRCKALNTFISNYVEAGMLHYKTFAPESDLIAVVLKHIELNAELYSGVKKVEGEDGKIYMRITEDLFNSRMDRLFDRDIPASSCPGYEDGSILVSARHYNGPIRVFGSVYDCSQVEEDIYRVSFNAYLVNEDFSGWYKTAHSNLPQDKLSLLGSGTALVEYDGGETVDSISVTDFILLEYELEAKGIPCTDANLPYGVEEIQPPTEPPTEQPTEAPAPTPTEEREEEEAPITFPNEKEEEDEPAKEIVRDNDRGLLILIIVLVVIIAVLALVVILLVIRRKK